MKFFDLKAALAGIALCSVVACAGADKKDDGPEVKNTSGGAAPKDEAQTASSNRVTLTSSLSNNPLTSLTINPAKAEKFSGDGKDKRSLEGKISADRVSRKGAGVVIATAKKLAEQEMEKGAGRTVADEVKLDIALSAIQNKNYPLAEYFLQELTDSKNAKVKAGAYNAMGVIALGDNRVPEAVLYFREALKASSGYKPAKYNLGFTALKGGDLGTAKGALSDYQSDWFAQSAMISIARMEGDGNRAADLCGKVLSAEPGHKAALYNCGLVELQNRKNPAKAKEYVKKAAAAKGGEAAWDERIGSTLTEAEAEDSRARQKAAEAKPAAAPKAKTGAASGPSSGSGS